MPMLQICAKDGIQRKKINQTSNLKSKAMLKNKTEFWRNSKRSKLPDESQ